MMSGRHQVVREILAHCFTCWRREAPGPGFLLLPLGPSSAPELLAGGCPAAGAQGVTQDVPLCGCPTGLRSAGIHLCPPFTNCCHCEQVWSPP